MDTGQTVRRFLTPVAIGSLLITTGCQTLLRSVGLDTGAATPNHEEVRGLLAAGQYDVALERIGPEGDAAPTDAALWLLYQGTLRPAVLDSLQLQSEPLRLPAVVVSAPL